MTCCDSPSVRQNDTHTAATCAGCGFRWTFEHQGKGKFKSKNPKWGPKWFCIDQYDRKWRLRGYERHEVIGTRQRGKRKDLLIGCSKFGNTISVSHDDPPDDVYCPDCQRSGPLGPMLVRYRTRKQDDDDSGI